MVVLWLLDIAHFVLIWFFLLFGVLLAVNLPGAFSIQVPVPFVGATGVAVLNTWAATSIVVAVALVVGKIL